MRTSIKHATTIALLCAAISAPLVVGCAHHDELIRAQNRAAEANVRALRAEQEADANRQSARSAEIARFEAENRAQEAERARAAAAERARLESGSTTRTYQRIESTSGSGVHIDEVETR